MTRFLPARALNRLTSLLLLGFCFALWPLAGYAATVLVTSPESENGVDAPDQALVVSKSASTAQATAGDTVTYTYQITNSGTVTILIAGADDDRLGPIVALLGQLPPQSTRSTTRSRVVQASDPVGPLVNTIVVTGFVGLDAPVIVVVASAVVTITGPTSLPETEQPNQSIEMFLPSIRP